MKIFLVVLILVVLLVLSFIPIWPKQVKSGYIKVNTWTKIQILRGKVFID